MRKNNNRVIGLVFIGLAILYLFMALGVFPRFNFWDLAWAVAGISLLYIGVDNKNFYSLFFGIALLLDLVNGTIRIPLLENLSFMNLLLIAGLLGVGFELIYGGNRHDTFNRHGGKQGARKEHVSYPEEDVVYTEAPYAEPEAAEYVNYPEEAIEVEIYEESGPVVEGEFVEADVIITAASKVADEALEPVEEEAGAIDVELTEVREQLDKMNDDLLRAKEQGVFAAKSDVGSTQASAIIADSEVIDGELGEGAVDVANSDAETEDTAETVHEEEAPRNTKRQSKQQQYQNNYQNKHKFTEDHQTFEQKEPNFGQQNYQYQNTNGYYQGNSDSRDNLLYVSALFNGVKKFVRATEFEGGEIRTTFGSMQIDFTQSTLSPDGARLMVQCSFGKTTIYIPRTWAVENNMSISLGTINDDRGFSNDQTRPRLELYGQVSFGEVVIVYV